MSLQDFEFSNKLGEGAFSTVYKVKRKADGEIYALKQVKLGNLSRKEKENALNEIRILASFNHENIIGFKEAFLDDSSSLLCIVMEYAEGGDLLNMINKHKSHKSKIPESEIWDILTQSLEGLKSLHDSNILHRDIKSANIFKTTTKVKLGDLNVSKVVKYGMAHTQTGTPYYASPEVWKDQPYGSASDIWSLGCVIYELAALAPPFNGSDMSSLCKNVIRGYFRDPIGVSKDLIKVIRSMLQVTAALRPTAKTLLETLTFSHKKSKIPCENSYQLLKTIFFDNKPSALRSRLPESRYNRALSIDSCKENLPEDSFDTSTDNSIKEKHQKLPKIPLGKALPSKSSKPPKPSNNIQNNEIKSPNIIPKGLPSPTIVTHESQVRSQIRRVGSLILEPVRYHSPQVPNYERILSLGNLEKPYSPKPLWWG